MQVVRTIYQTLDLSRSGSGNKLKHIRVLDRNFSLVTKLNFTILEADRITLLIDTCQNESSAGKFNIINILLTDVYVSLLSRIVHNDYIRTCGYGNAIDAIKSAIFDHEGDRCGNYISFGSIRLFQSIGSIWKILKCRR